MLLILTSAAAFITLLRHAAFAMPLLTLRAIRYYVTPLMLLLMAIAVIANILIRFRYAAADAADVTRHAMPYASFRHAATSFSLHLRVSFSPSIFSLSLMPPLMPRR